MRGGRLTMLNELLEKVGGLAAYRGIFRAAGAGVALEAMRAALRAREGLIPPGWVEISGRFYWWDGTDWGQPVL